MTGVTVRRATADDCGLILDFIRELALYERAPEAVAMTKPIGAAPSVEGGPGKEDGAVKAATVFVPVSR